MTVCLLSVRSVRMVFVYRRAERRRCAGLGKRHPLKRPSSSRSTGSRWNLVGPYCSSPPLAWLTRAYNTRGTACITVLTLSGHHSCGGLENSSIALPLLHSSIKLRALWSASLQKLTFGIDFNRGILGMEMDRFGRLGKSACANVTAIPPCLLLRDVGACSGLWPPLADHGSQVTPWRSVNVDLLLRTLFRAPLFLLTPPLRVVSPFLLPLPPPRFGRTSAKT